MKKIIYIFIILILIGLPLTTNAVGTDSSDSNVMNLYVFYDKEDSDFKIIQDWLEDYRIGKENFNINYINANNNVEFLTNVKKNLNINEDQFPIFIIGSNYLTDFNNNIRNDLLDIIFAYENSTKYCDVLQSIISSEPQDKIDFCIEQNKDVFVKEKPENYKFRIILLACFICLIPITTIIIIVVKNIEKDTKSSKKKA